MKEAAECNQFETDPLMENLINILHEGIFMTIECSRSVHFIVSYPML